jgi:hypothetical protein
LVADAVANGDATAVNWIADTMREQVSYAIRTTMGNCRTADHLTSHLCTSHGQVSTAGDVRGDKIK